MLYSYYQVLIVFWGSIIYVGYDLLFLYLQILSCKNIDQDKLDDLQEPSCFFDIVPFAQAELEHRKVIQFYFQFGDDYHDLILKETHIGYSFGPNHWNLTEGYLYKFENSSGELIDEFTDEVPIRKFVEDVGCVMLQHDEVEFIIGYEFTNENIHQVRIIDMGVEIFCGDSSYIGSGKELMLIPLSNCQKVLCESSISEGDPWCE